uniref:Uncharacterized protein n=1 Tax=Cyprinus carpio TaxID=7962 RepID=A0A8C2FI05_CYPCA
MRMKIALDFLHSPSVLCAKEILTKESNVQEVRC